MHELVVECGMGDIVINRVRSEGVCNDTVSTAVSMAKDKEN